MVKNSTRQIWQMLAVIFAIYLIYVATVIMPQSIHSKLVLLVGVGTLLTDSWFLINT